MPVETKNAPRPGNPTPSQARHRAPWIRRAVFVAALAVLGVFAFRAINTHTNPQEPLRVATNPWPGYEFAFLAQELGYFEQEGVDVRILEFSSLSDARKSFERNQTDGFFGTIVELMEARAKTDRNPRPVLACDYSDGADVIVAREGIDAPRDLRGKRIAVERDTLTVYVLGRALERAGVPWDEVEPVYIAGVDMPAALASGMVDAAVTYPPISIEIDNAGTAHVIFSTDEIPGEVLDVLSFAEDIAAERADEIAAFNRAYFRAVEYAFASPEIAFPIMADRQRITPEEFAESLESGLKLIAQGDQNDYLKPGGIADQVIIRTDRIMNTADNNASAFASPASASAEGDE